MEFQKILEKRASVKKYLSKKPAIENIIEAIHAANMAPAAGNLQELKYIVVDELEKISIIADACQQEFIRKAPYVIVICSNPKQLKKLYDVRANKYMKHHVGAAVENFLLKITDLGLASCWVGAFSEPIIRSTLGIPDNYEIELILTVGYELQTEKTKQKIKHSLVNKVFFNYWWNRFYKPFIKVRRSDV